IGDVLYARQLNPAFPRADIGVESRKLGTASGNHPEEVRGVATRGARGGQRRGRGKRGYRIAAERGVERGPEPRQAGSQSANLVLRNLGFIAGAERGRLAGLARGDSRLRNFGGRV